MPTTKKIETSVYKLSNNQIKNIGDSNKPNFLKKRRIYSNTKHILQTEQTSVGKTKETIQY